MPEALHEKTKIEALHEITDFVHEMLSVCAPEEAFIDRPQTLYLYQSNVHTLIPDLISATSKLQIIKFYIISKQFVIACNTSNDIVHINQNNIY